LGESAGIIRAAIQRLERIQRGLFIPRIKLTTKHLVLHSMNPKEYRKKYGFSAKTPLSAKSLTKARSKSAKKRGLPEKLQKYIEAKRQAKAEVAAKSSGPAAETGKKVKRRASRKKTA
jgi:hypothetical protein